MRCGVRYWRRMRNSRVCEQWIRWPRWLRKRGGWFAAMRDNGDYAVLRELPMRGRFSDWRRCLNGLAKGRDFFRRRSWTRRCAELLGRDWWNFRRVEWCWLGLMG